MRSIFATTDSTTCIFIFILILIAFIGSIDCKKKKQVQVKFLTANVDGGPKYIDFLQGGITPGSNGRSFDVKAHLIANITKDLGVALDFFMKDKPESQYHAFFSYDFEMCKLMEGFMSATVARVWALSMKKFSNFPIACPIMQGDYYIKKMSVDRKSIPMVAINGFYMVKMHMYVKKASIRETLANATLEAEVTL